MSRSLRAGRGRQPGCAGSSIPRAAGTSWAELGAERREIGQTLAATKRLCGQEHQSGDTAACLGAVMEMESHWPGRLPRHAGNAPTSSWPLCRLLQSISQMLNLALKSKYKGGTVPRWPKSAAQLPGPAGELAGSVYFM